ncbi:MAG: hypothetical protein ACOYZ7_19200 [Chloroflexota bacterium]
MARPIPINEAGLRRGRRHFDAAVATPTIGVAPRVPPTIAPRVSAGRSALNGQFLLLVSALLGGLAVVSGLGLWPAIGVNNLGLDEKGTFYLLVSGAYLLATNVYASWKTRMLHNPSGAPWDARLMAYVNLALGGFVIAMLSMAVLAVVALIAAMAWFGALILGSTGGQSGE